MFQTFLPKAIATLLFPRTTDIVYRPNDISLQKLSHAIEYVKVAGEEINVDNYQLSVRPTNGGSWLLCKKLDTNGTIKLELSIKVDSNGKITFAELSNTQKSHLRYSAESGAALPKQFTKVINEVCNLGLGQHKTLEK